MVPVVGVLVAFDPSFVDSSYSGSSFVAASSFADALAVASFAVSSLAGARASHSTVVVDRMAVLGDLVRADVVVAVAVELPPVASSDHASSVASPAPCVVASPVAVRMGPVLCRARSERCNRLNLASIPTRFDCRYQLAVSVVVAVDAGAIAVVRPFAIRPALAGIVTAGGIERVAVAINRRVELATNVARASVLCPIYARRYRPDRSYRLGRLLGRLRQTFHGTNQTNAPYRSCSIGYRRNLAIGRQCVDSLLTRILSPFCTV